MTLHSTEDRPVNMVMVAREGDTVARRSVPLPYPSSMVVPISAGLNSKLASYPQSMARPSPSVSNRGLVIVQVQESAHSYRLLPVQDTVLGGEEGGDRAVEARDLSNKLVDSSAHQLIHGYPPNTFLAEDEEEEEEEVEDEEEDTDFGAHDESDEGYRTNSSVASGSPLVETAVSPGPGVEEGSRWVLSWCLGVILSYCQGGVMVSYCHTVMVSGWCHGVRVVSWCHTLMESRCHAVMPWW